MAPMRPIELLRVSGSRERVGRQIGEALAPQIREDIEAVLSDIPAGRTADEQLQLAARYRTVTAEALPWLMEELDAVAEGAGVDPVGFFATGIEEIGYEPRLPKGRCSDLVAAPPATADGHLIVGHNNDLYPKDEDPVIAIERTVEDAPVVFTIGVGPWPSVGYNSGGLSMTGNELSPNDEVVGIPRLVQFLGMLYQPSLGAARDLALHPDRASSYNNVLASRGGEVVNVEGSASDAELTGPDERGVLAHTNHYACARMLPFEGDPAYAKHSAIRLERAREMLSDASGTITMPSMRRMLSDHANAPDSICRHHRESLEDYSKTVFWTVCDVTDMRILYGRGNPCDPVEQAYNF